LYHCFNCRSIRVLIKALFLVESEQRKDSLNVSDEKLDVEKVHEDVEEVIISDKMNEDDANDNDNETNVKCGADSPLVVCPFPGQTIVLSLFSVLYNYITGCI
jgi:hypothetical protein